MDNEVIFSSVPGSGGSVGLITLNRPKALNALSFTMATAISQELKTWAYDASIKAVVILGQCDKAFCAGGDLKAVYSLGPGNTQIAEKFFALEYDLNHLIKDYPKPYISLVHGITMGGGIGLSIHGSQRVASPDLLWAMPETGIGFFPDVGASFFLSRCAGNIGLYLGLTGSRIGIIDALYCGLIDYCIPQEQFQHVVAAIAAADFNNNDDKIIAAILAKFSVTPRGEGIIQPYLAEINQLFSAATITDLVDGLKTAAATNSWAATTAKILSTKSPTSLCMTFAELTKAKTVDFSACLHMEYVLSQQCLLGADFYEGIRSVVIDKDNAPMWQPATLAEAASVRLDLGL